jgi:hypothetical protein
MDVTIAGYIERWVERHTTNSRLGAAGVRADCLRCCQIGIGLWEERYLFTRKEYTIFSRPVSMVLFPSGV